MCGWGSCGRPAAHIFDPTYKPGVGQPGLSCCHYRHKANTNERKQAAGACLGLGSVDRAQLDGHNIKQPFCCYGNNIFVVVNYRSLLPCTILFNARTQKTIYKYIGAFVNALSVDG